MFSICVEMLDSWRALSLSGVSTNSTTLLPYRRRNYTEEMAKVVATVWGERMDSIPCRTTDSGPG